MLKIEDTCLVIVDVQGRLAEVMYDKESLVKNLQILINAAKILEIPIIWCQQVPKALGNTIPELAALLEDVEPVNKYSFSCFKDDEFKARLAELDKKNVILTGIESHICIYQTAIDLLAEGKRVTVPADAVSSRTLQNKQIALNTMRHESVKIASTEMILFELLGDAKHSAFRQIAKLVK